jgi:hypothetical protein
MLWRDQKGRQWRHRTWTGRSAIAHRLPNDLLALPMVTEFSAQLAAVGHIAFGMNSRQRKLA